MTAVAQEESASPDPEFLALVFATHAGNPPALTALGTRLVAGRDAPHSPADGEALITEAAKQGNADAWHYLAVFAAAGLLRSPCWDTAWSALQRAAALGHAQAALQVQRFADAGIRSVADVIAWLSPPPQRQIHDNPRVAAIREFLPPAFCTHLRELATPRLERAQVYDAQQSRLKRDPMRTNSNAALSVVDTDVLLQMVRARISCASGVEGRALEPPEVLHYAPGEQYRLHVDFFHPSVPHFAELIRNSGQRIKTCLVYLNEDYAGGETHFPELGIKFRGHSGEALLFENVGADGAGDMRTAHAGLPLASGIKWLFSQWIRDRPQRIA